MLNIAVLVSGGGTNLQALLDQQKAGGNPHGRIALVVASRRDAYALERAKQHGVATAVLTGKMAPTQDEYDAALDRLMVEHSIDLIVLAGFLRILGPSFTRKYDHRILNVHPSLIPAFCGEGFYGLRVHEAALAYGVKVTGATVHYVNEVTDGGQIIAQKTVEVQPDDTAETLQRRVMEQAEWVLLPQAVAQISAKLDQRKKEETMEQFELADLLKNNTYPGRGIVLGRSEDGTKDVIAYFIMGRSSNSRNRVFVEDGAGIRTQAFDPSKMEDPSLIIYHPVRVLGDGRTVVTNGDQTDTIYDFLQAGKTFEDALRTRTFEPDGPNYTPRVSGLVEKDGYRLSILKSADGDPASVRRYFYEYRDPKAGQGHFIHTYKCDGSPIPSFEGEPEQVSIHGGIDAFTGLIWQKLNLDNKVSLFVRFIDRVTGEYETRICNKNQ